MPSWILFPLGYRELVSVLTSLPRSQFKFRFRFRIPDSGFLLFDTPVLQTAARLICCAPRFSHITPLMYELHWLPLKQRIHFKILLFAFKAIHGIAPTYIQNLVSLKSQGTYNLRSSGWILLASSTFRTNITLGDRSFQVAAPKLWYALPRELRDIPSLHTFTYLFKFAYGWMNFNCYTSIF